MRVAYVIPSNRTAQPDGVRNLRCAIQLGQEFFRKQMVQYGFGGKTFRFETEDDGVTPLIHVVEVNETDDYIRGDTWGRTLQAAANAGISIWSPGEIWVLVPESHLMMADGSVIGGVALGASAGSGNSGGVAMISSNALFLLNPSMVTNDTFYNGETVHDLGPFPMKQDVTFAWFEGATFSSLASSWFGALWHEMGHAFGLPHDFRNDNNFHGNLMGNGLRGTRGTLFPDKYPQDYTRLEYASALIFNESHYFNANNVVTSSPVISYNNPVNVTPIHGLVRMTFQASDADSLGAAVLTYRGDMVAEVALQGTTTEATFAIPYYSPGNENPYTIGVFDKQGNASHLNFQLTVTGVGNQAPIPFLKISPAAPGPDEPITMDASQSSDANHSSSSLLVSWDVHDDGVWEFEAIPIMKVVEFRGAAGNYLLRAKVTDPESDYSLSTVLSFTLAGEKKIAVESLTLMDADTDEPIRDLENGLVINLTEWGSSKFSIQANVRNDNIDHIEFDLKGPVNHQQTEQYLPYSLFGDNPTDDLIGKYLQPGEYTLNVTPYSTPTEKGIASSISFKVVGPVPGLPSIIANTTIGGALSDDVGLGLVTQDGGYLLAGYSSSNISGDKTENSRGGADYWIVKIDSLHNRVWDKTFGGDHLDFLTTIVPSSHGGYLLAGYSLSEKSGDKSERSKGSEDYWIVKIDKHGNKQWDKSFGGDGMDYLSCAVETSEGGYLLCGFSDSNASGDKSENSKGGRDIWLVRVDKRGKKIWDRTIGGSNDDEPRKIIESDGGWILFASSVSDASGDKTENSRGSSDYWVIKIDRRGRVIWDKTIGGSDSDTFSDATPTSDGGYMLLGSSISNRSGDKTEDSKGNWDYWVVKIDKAGNKIWDKAFGGSARDAAANVVATTDKGYLLGGITNSDASGDKSENVHGWEDYWVVKIDARGNKIWDKNIGGEAADNLTSILLTKNSNYLLTGSSSSDISGDKSENSKGMTDFWIAELRPPIHPVVASLTMINAETDQDIDELRNGDVIRLTEVRTRLLDIRANVSAPGITKVVFHLTGPVKHYQIERHAPYALFGNDEGNFFGQKFLSGEYRLIVTPYLNNREVVPLIISFTIEDGFGVGGFTLVDATLDQSVRELIDGDVIDLSQFDTRDLTIRADINPLRIDRVDLSLSYGPFSFINEDRSYPYDMFGSTSQNENIDYKGVKLLAGHYTVSATPHYHGVLGTKAVINFKVVKNQQSQRIEIYPVPTTGTLNIKFSERTSGVDIVLLDMFGNVLIKRAVENTSLEQLNLGGFRKGIYFVKVTGLDRPYFTRILFE